MGMEKSHPGKFCDVVMGNATTMRRMFIASNFNSLLILSIFYVENEFKVKELIR